MRLTFALSLALAALAGTGCASMPRRSDGGAPATFERTTADARTTRVIAVRDGLTKAVAWRVLGETLAAAHSVDVRDQQAGFVMTAWESSVARGGVPDPRYRTRVTTRFVGTDWKQLQLRVEANWRDGEEWDVGTDRELLERVATELQARLGKK